MIPNTCWIIEIAVVTNAPLTMVASYKKHIFYLNPDSRYSRFKSPGPFQMPSIFQTPLNNSIYYIILITMSYNLNHAYLSTISLYFIKSNLSSKKQS